MRSIVLFGCLLALNACTAQEAPQATATPEPQSDFVENRYRIIPVDLGTRPGRWSGEIKTMEDAHDAAVHGNDLIVEGFDRQRELLKVILIGHPMFGDTKAPDPKIQKTYRPEKLQDMPRGEDCVFWFSPYHQLTLRWDYEVIPGRDRPHVTITGEFYRKTYRE